MGESTSYEVYKKIKDNRLLSKKRFAVYEALFKIKRPATSNEIFTAMRVPNIQNNNIAPRLTELCELGVVKKHAKAVCPVTGNRVIVWALSGDLPYIQARKSNLAKLKEREKKLAFELGKVRRDIKTEQAKMDHKNQLPLFRETSRKPVPLISPLST